MYCEKQPILTDPKTSFDYCEIFNVFTCPTQLLPVVAEDIDLILKTRHSVVSLNTSVVDCQIKCSGNNDNDIFCYI